MNGSKTLKARGWLNILLSLNLIKNVISLWNQFSCEIWLNINLHFSWLNVLSTISVHYFKMLQFRENLNNVPSLNWEVWIFEILFIRRSEIIFFCNKLDSNLLTSISQKGNFLSLCLKSFKLPHVFRKFMIISMKGNILYFCIELFWG